MHAVFTAEDLHPDAHQAWYSLVGPDEQDVPRPPLAEGEVRFVGDPVAVVIAESRYIAEDAAELVFVDYEPLPALADYIAAIGADERCTTSSRGTSSPRSASSRRRRCRRSTPSRRTWCSETFYQQAYVAVPLETRGLVVEWSAPSGEMTIWAATQAPHEVRVGLRRACSTCPSRRSG